MISSLRIRIIPLLLLLTVSCDRSVVTDCVVIDESLLQEGDLVFRLGRGTSSRIVNLADKEKSYSHIGFLVKDSVGWCVIHAVPGESDETGGREIIKCDPIMQFFGHDRTINGIIMRFDSIDKVSNHVVKQAKEFYQQQLLFDHDYSLSDSSTLYCTELIHRVFLCANIDLSEDRRHTFPLIKEYIIFPSDILQNKRLHEVCKIKFVASRYSKHNRRIQ